MTTQTFFQKKKWRHKHWSRKILKIHITLTTRKMTYNHEEVYSNSYRPNIILPVSLLVYQECSKGQTNAYWSQPNSFVILYTRLSMCLIKSNLINKKEGPSWIKIYLPDRLSASHNLMNGITDSFILGSDSQFHCNILWTVKSKRQPHKHLYISYEYTRQQTCVWSWIGWNNLGTLHSPQIKIRRYHDP